MATARTRTRLTPSARTDQLLDVAKQLIVDFGLQNFTVEALARAAGVSSPLVYNYFRSRNSLLQDLLVREYRGYSENLHHEVSAAKSFEEVVRMFIASNFDHHAHGNILPILQSQPEIAAVIDAEREENGKEIARYLMQNAARNYELTRSQAALAVRISSGASIAAAEYAASSGADRDETIAAALNYILAGLSRIAGGED